MSARACRDDPPGGVCRGELPVLRAQTLTILEGSFAEPGSGEGWKSMQQTIAFSDEIQQDDVVLCERGLRSRAYDTGRFRAKRGERPLSPPVPRARVPGE